MNTLVDFLEREQRTFSELALTPVDSLVLSSLVYFNFDAAGVVERQSSARVLLHDVVALTPHDALTSSSWLEDADLTERFVRAVMASRRYRSVLVTFFVNDLSSSIEKQFSAVTFVIPQGAPGQDLLYVAFRGTDGTLAGWKEDFNLTFKDVIPSQAAALRYLSGVASTCTCPLMVGGHSKGGNLAEYSALACDDATFARLEAVFDHDGPAFFDDPAPRINEPAYERKLHKTVPVSSVFGLMLERRESYRIVQSDALPFLSHSPFTWQVKGGEFVYEDKLTRGSTAFDQSLDEWLHSVDAEQRELFIDTVYELFVSTEASTWSEFQENLPKNVATMVGQGARLDAETRSFLLRTFGQGIAILTSSTARSLLPDPSKRISLPPRPHV